MQNCSAETNLEGIKLTFPKGGFNRAYSPPESLYYGRVLDYKCRSINSGIFTMAPYTYSYSYSQSKTCNLYSGFYATAARA